MPTPLEPLAPLSTTPREPLVPLKTGARALAVSAKLTLRRSGVLSSESFSIGEHVIIGRFDAETGPVDVDLGDLPEGSYLSRQHAELWRDSNGKWFVKDLGSHNGTFVLSGYSAKFERVTQDQPINDGDQIAFGNARFEFRTIKAV
jgi:pSer/pThr/pTyr-binding forkhead associated (FHA) protein